MKGPTLKWTSQTNEQLSSCLWLLVHCSFVHCLHYVLWCNLFSFPAQSLASVDSAADRDGVCCCSSAHVQISNQCSASALCCVVLNVCPVLYLVHMACLSAPSNGCDVNIGLLLPWPTMHLQTKQKKKTHPSHPHPSQSWLAVAMTTSRCPALPLPACSDRGSLPCPMSCAVYGWLCSGERCSSPKFGLIADRYHFCEKCFNEIQGETVSLGDDPTQPQTWVSASFFSF